MKPWWKSKTMWFNIGVFLTATGNELLPLLALVEPETATTARVFLVLATSVGNMLLRTATNTKVTL